MVRSCEGLQKIVSVPWEASLTQLTLTIADLYGVGLALAHLYNKTNSTPSYLRYPFRK